MKPTSKQLMDLQLRISAAYKERELRNAEIGHLAGVHPSQVGRICAGDFKTISNSVVQICRVLKVVVPRIEERPSKDLEWEKANASLRRIWDQPPKKMLIKRVLEAVLDLRVAPPKDGKRRRSPHVARKPR